MNCGVNLTAPRGHLYNMLCNPIYIGEIRHKDQRFPGRHEGIVARDVWGRVQTLLEGRSQTVRGKGRLAADRSPLTGRLFDETGDRLTPSYTKKKDQRIRYFVSNRLVDRSSTRTGVSNVEVARDLAGSASIYHPMRAAVASQGHIRNWQGNAKFAKRLDELDHRR